MKNEILIRDCDLTLEEMAKQFNFGDKVIKKNDSLFYVTNDKVYQLIRGRIDFYKLKDE